MLLDDIASLAAGSNDCQQPKPTLRECQMFNGLVCDEYTCSNCNFCAYCGDTGDCLVCAVEALDSEEDDFAALYPELLQFRVVPVGGE